MQRDLTFKRFFDYLYKYARHWSLLQMLKTCDLSLNFLDMFVIEYRFLVIKYTEKHLLRESLIPTKSRRLPVSLIRPLNFLEKTPYGWWRVDNFMYPWYRKSPTFSINVAEAARGDLKVIHWTLKKYGKKADFPRFCINRFSIGPLHYILSHSDFGFQFVEILVIKKRLPDSTSWLLNV
jgi:hypothetical protein